MSFKIAGRTYRLLFAFFAIAMLILPLNNFNAHASEPVTVESANIKSISDGGGSTSSLTIPSFIIDSTSSHTITVVGLSYSDGSHGPPSSVSVKLGSSASSCSGGDPSLSIAGTDAVLNGGHAVVYTITNPGTGTHAICITFSGNAVSRVIAGGVTYHGVLSVGNTANPTGHSALATVTVPGAAGTSVIFGTLFYQSSSATSVGSNDVATWNISTSGDVGAAGYTQEACGHNSLSWSSNNQDWSTNAVELTAAVPGDNPTCPAATFDFTGISPNPFSVDPSTFTSGSLTVTVNRNPSAGDNPCTDPISLTTGAGTSAGISIDSTSISNPLTSGAVTFHLDSNVLNNPGFYTVVIHGSTTNCGSDDIVATIIIEGAIISCDVGSETITTVPSGDSVFYTTDGTNPTTASPTVSTPFVISPAANVVKAIIDNGDGGTIGNIATNTCLQRTGSEHRPAYPSLTGGALNDIPDPFSLNGIQFTVKGFVIDPPTQDLIINTDQTLVFKTFSVSGYGELLTHFGIYLGPHPSDNIGKMVVGIVWDRDGGVTTVDPQGLISHVSVSEVKKNNQDEFTIHFTPLKQLPTSDMILRMWNIKHSSVDYHGFNFARFTNEHLAPAQAQLPDNIQVYDNLADLNKQIQSSGYIKPTILSHIHDTASVFQDTSSVSQDTPGKVYWLYDTTNNSVTLIIEDGNGKVVGMYPESLVKQDSLTPSMSTDKTYNSLSRWNVDSMKSAQSDEAVKALNTMIKMYGRNSVVQYGFLG